MFRASAAHATFLMDLPGRAAIAVALIETVWADKARRHADNSMQFNRQALSASLADAMRSNATMNNQGHAKKQAATSGINVDEILPLGEAMRRLGWGKAMLRRAKQGGLRILCVARRSYLYGRDLLDYLKQQPPAQRNRGGGRPDLIRDGRPAGTGKPREEPES